MLGHVFCLFLVNFMKKMWGEVLLLISFLNLFLMCRGGDLMVYVNNFFFFDMMSKVLVLLSYWVILLCIMGSFYIKGSSLDKGYLLVLVFMMLFLLLSFTVSGFLFFYIFFECTLIPIFIMVLGWGYQPERLGAGMYLMFYTLFGSFPLFCVIVYLLNFFDYSMVNMSYRLDNLWVFFFIVMGFVIKFPLYGFHLWLLKAHVEAPVAGSMVLAGVLLKLGGYGLIRFSVLWSSYASLIFDFFVLFSVWGGMIMSFHCFRMVDMKLLIASSSVVHMSMCVASVFYLSDWGYMGCMMMMVAHGLISSGMFYICNLFYIRIGSRSLLVCKGLMNLMPSMCLWWFVMCVYNMAAPPSLNLWSEVVLINNLLGWSFYFFMVIGLMGFMSGGYSLFLYSISQHGLYWESKVSYNSGSVFEFFISVLHIMPVNLLVLSCFLFF